MLNLQKLTYAEAIEQALDLSLDHYPEAYIIGEGVTDPKGIFGTTSGLFKKYGAQRVVEMPVAENGLTGIAIGSAMVGQRPILIHQRVDFSLLSLEQIFNNAAKLHYLSAGAHKVPLVIRMIIGRGWGQGPQHSQSLESVFAHIPGLKVVMPSTPRDAKGMMIAAIEDNNPVIFLEHRWLHHTFGEVPEGYYTTPLNGPQVVRTGTNITVAATSLMVIETLRAAQFLSEIGYETEVIDMRLLRPLQLQPIVQSVYKTGALLTVDIGWQTCGIGAEIIAGILPQCFSRLRMPPARLGMADHPTPSSRGLMDGFYPSPAAIARHIAEMVGVSVEQKQHLENIIHNQTKDELIDVPNQSFKGPF